MLNIFDEYYIHEVLKEKTDAERETAEILKDASQLHDYLRPNLPKLLYIGFKLIPQIPYKIGFLANVFLYKHMYKWYTKSGKLYICRRESAWHLWSI